MSDIDRILASMNVFPGDGLAHLALADCLEEEGDPIRGELARTHGLLLAEYTPERERRVQELILAGVAPCVPTITNSIGMKLAAIPPGTFLMGSPATEAGRCENEGPQHEVELTEPFYMGIYQVTQEEYEAVMGTNPSHFKGGRLPVEKVSWHDAVEFCKKLSERPEEKAAGLEYRLPTEAEWEYACRAGTRSRFWCGNDDATLERVAWLHSNSGGHTRPVGELLPNPFGLHDVHGNVWEWCQDWYGPYTEE